MEEWKQGIALAIIFIFWIFGQIGVVALCEEEKWSYKTTIILLLTYYLLTAYLESLI